MKKNEILARDLIRDIAKGRYTAAQVEQIFCSVYEDGVKDGMERNDKRAVEAMVYLVAQELHYYKGFGKKRLDDVFCNGLKERLEGIYCGAYDISDVVRALKEDADWQWNVKWKE